MPETQVFKRRSVSIALHQVVVEPLSITSNKELYKATITLKQMANVRLKF